MLSSSDMKLAQHLNHHKAVIMKSGGDAIPPIRLGTAVSARYVGSAKTVSKLCRVLAVSRKALLATDLSKALRDDVRPAGILLVNTAR